MLELQNFLIKEQAALLKLTDTYDIFNPESGEQIAQAKEVVSGRLIDNPGDRRAALAMLAD
jgi:hypothetical protein